MTVLRKLTAPRFTFLDVFIVAFIIIVLGNLQSGLGWPWWAADLAVLSLGAAMGIAQAFLRKRAGWEARRVLASMGVPPPVPSSRRLPGEPPADYDD
jgi:hypothetical protein